MPSFTWKIVRNVRAREGCRNYLELTESVFYYCKTAAGKLATMISPWSFPWRRLIKRSNTATFKRTKNLRGDPPYFTNTYRISTGGREFSAVERKPYCFGRSAIKLLTESMPTEAIFYQPKPFILNWANKESGKNCKRYSMLSGSLKLFFLPLTITVDSTFVAGHATKIPQRDYCSKWCSCKDLHARTPRNFMGATRGRALP